MSSATAPQPANIMQEGKLVTLTDFNKRYDQLTTRVHCECHLVRELVGGQPADDKGLRAFAEFQLGLKDNEEEIQKAVARIRGDEIGTHEENPGLGELLESKVYGVNSLRHDKFGVWIGDWMVKAALKQSLSILEVFSTVMRSKSMIAESGRAKARGVSLLNEGHPYRIYLVQPDGVSNIETYYREFMGRVNTPQGPTSIIHHSECAPEGSRFEFEFRFLPGKIKFEDIRDGFTFMMECGLGSGRAMERGKFVIDRMMFYDAAERRAGRVPKEEKKQVQINAATVAKAKVEFDKLEAKEQREEPLVRGKVRKHKE